MALDEKERIVWEAVMEAHRSAYRSNNNADPVSSAYAHGRRDGLLDLFAKLTESEVETEYERAMDQLIAEHEQAIAQGD